MHGAMAQHAMVQHVYYVATFMVLGAINHYVAIRGGQTAADGILHATLQTGSGQQTTWQRS
jgi:hypothetical protein